jgi:hypothetical protein
MSSLCKHKLSCSKQPIYAIDVETTIQTKEPDKDFTEKELMLTILKENSELKTMILDVYKTMATTNNSTNHSNNNNSINHSNNNSNNKTFNIQVYLNEDCKAD